MSRRAWLPWGVSLAVSLGVACAPRPVVEVAGTPALMAGAIAGASGTDPGQGGDGPLGVDSPPSGSRAGAASGTDPGSWIGVPPGVPAADDTAGPPTEAPGAGRREAPQPDDDGVEPGDLPGASGPGLGDVDLLWTEDFEAGTVGETPPDWDTFIAWNANAGNNPMDNLFAVVGDGEPYRGAQALHVRGGSNPAQLTRTLPADVTRLHVRAYVRMVNRQLGQNPGANHETLFAIRGIPGAAHDEVRFGEIKGTIGTNEVPSDNIAPRMELWGQGPVVPVGEWACIEVAFIADQVPHRLQAWLDGTLIHEVTDPGADFQNGPLKETWLEGHFTEVVVGWHSFSGQDAELWIDELVVARSRIGC